jgi:hypothetical protein
LYKKVFQEAVVRTLVLYGPELNENQIVFDSFLLGGYIFHIYTVNVYYSLRIFAGPRQLSTDYFVNSFTDSVESGNFTSLLREISRENNAIAFQNAYSSHVYLGCTAQCDAVGSFHSRSTVLETAIIIVIVLLVVSIVTVLIYCYVQPSRRKRSPMEFFDLETPSPPSPPLRVKNPMVNYSRVNTTDPTEKGAGEGEVELSSVSNVNNRNNNSNNDEEDSDIIL